MCKIAAKSNFLLFVSHRNRSSSKHRHLRSECCPSLEKRCLTDINKTEQSSDAHREINSQLIFFTVAIDKVALFLPSFYRPPMPSRVLGPKTI